MQNQKRNLFFILVAVLALAAPYLVRYLRARHESQLLDMALANAATIAKDFSTPEGAILRLEDAYRKRDIEIAVSCKDFLTEARLMLEKSDKVESDEELVRKTAKTLELSYR